MEVFLIGIALIVLGRAIRRSVKSSVKSITIVVEHRHFYEPSPRGPGDPLPHPLPDNVVVLKQWRKAA